MLRFYIIYVKVLQIEILNKSVVQSLNIVLIIASSADPDLMQHYDAFHLGPDCFSSIQL